MKSSNILFINGVVLLISATLLKYAYDCYYYLPPSLDAYSLREYRNFINEYKDFILKGFEKGSSVYVQINETKLIDIKSGYKDPQFHIKWSDETITQGFTLSILAVPLSIALLIDRELIALDTRVSDVLPEFISKNISVSDLLQHKAGYPYLNELLTIDELKNDFENILNRFSMEIPVVSTQSVPYFHYHTLSILGDAIVRKVDPKKRNLAYFFMQEFVWPLGLDIVIGIPRTNVYRLARPYHCGKLDVISSYMRFDFSVMKTQPVYHENTVFSSESERWKAINLFSDYKIMRSYDVDLLEVPLCSTNMFTNARSLANLMGNIFFTNRKSSSTVKGVKLKESTLNWLLSNSLENSFDPVLERYENYNNAGLMVKKSPRGTDMIGIWDDIMGQMVLYDNHFNLSIAYVTNYAHCRTLNSDFILQKIIDDVYSAL